MPFPHPFPVTNQGGKLGWVLQNYRGDLGEQVPLTYYKKSSILLEEWEVCRDICFAGPIYQLFRHYYKDHIKT